VTSPLVLTRAQVAEILDWTAVLSATRKGLMVAGSPPAGSALAGQVTYDAGSLHLKAAALDQERIISVKSNLRPTRGGASGVLLAYDLDAEALTGIIDAGLMTAWRTGAMAALAAQRFVEQSGVTVAVLGVGPVGRHCTQGILEVLDVAEIRFWSLHSSRSTTTSQEFSSRVASRTCSDVKDAVGGADVIITATPALVPILTDQEIKPGAVILAMGADTAGKRELGPRMTANAFTVSDVPSAALSVGESAYLPDNEKKEVSALSRWLDSNDLPPREKHHVVFDSVGSSHVDTAVTALIMSRATAQSIGQTLNW
jgi:ornithine cyclodeaminase/alanine dehydrogenase-like protein (mu-crystallin family)